MHIREDFIENGDTAVVDTLNRGVVGDAGRRCTLFTQRFRKFVCDLLSRNGQEEWLEPRDEGTDFAALTKFSCD